MLVMTVSSQCESHMCAFLYIWSLQEKSGNKIKRKYQLQYEWQTHKKLKEQLDIRFTAVGRVIWAVEVSFTDGTIKYRAAFLSEREAAHFKLN